MSMFLRKKISDPAALTDESKLTGKADNIISPLDENELRGALIFLNNRSLPANIAAMRTGVVGGAVPSGGDVIDLSNIRGITGVGRDDTGFYIRALACTTLREIDDSLRTGLDDSTPELSEGALEELRSSDKGYFYPVDPTELGGSVGGNIATNASGPRSFRYGPTRRWVKAIKVLFADGAYTWIERGRIHADGRRMSFSAGRNYYSFMIPSYDSLSGVKNAVGPMISEDMDLIDLFIGSEGIFGVIVEAEIRLIPRLPTISLAAFFPDDGSALDAAKELRASDVPVEFIEYLDCASLDLLRSVTASDPLFLPLPDFPAGAGSCLLFDIPRDVFPDIGDRLMGILESHGGSASMTWCATEDPDRERLRDLRHSVPRTVFEYVASLKNEMPRIHKMGTDMSVPDAAADEMMSYYKRELDSAGLGYVVFGHIGDNHPHVEIILESEDDFAKANEVYGRLARKAVELGGSPSAEHGIGKIKTDYVRLMYGDDAVEELRRIKRTLDPNMILCPGNLIGDAR